MPRDTAHQRIVDAYLARPGASTAELAKRAKASQEYVRKVCYRAGLPVPGTYGAGYAAALRDARKACLRCGDEPDSCDCGVRKVMTRLEREKAR